MKQLPHHPRCPIRVQFFVTAVMVACVYMGHSQQVKDKPSAISTPKLEDITASTGIHFEHLSSPEQRYIVESMSGGVALLDYDGDGWLDIYFTNAPSVSMVARRARRRKARSTITIMTAPLPTSPIRPALAIRAGRWERRSQT